MQQLVNYQTHRALRLAAAMLAAGMTCSCGGLQWESIWNAPSPSGKHFVSVVQDSQGAWSSNTYKVVVGSSNLGSGSSPFDVWVARGCRPSYVFWLGEQEIEILTRQDNERCASAKVYAAGDFRVRTGVLTGWLKEEVFRSGGK